MQPLSLTLKGFRGIRDGLGLDTFTLDFERLADGAALVAIAGANGRGKSTVMDNMHPYLSMPSRAAQAGAGGFSYYDQVCLPESEKDLSWAHEGRSYRSQVVIRSNGRRKTEAFLLALGDDGAWRPSTLADGTVSDGRVDTYTRCVEGICGPADTFFTSVFSAQGKRQLSAYRNAEIKTLLADLLGQDEVRALGQKASDTARLLKAGLAGLRAEGAASEGEGARLAVEVGQLAGAPQRVAQATTNRQAAQATLNSARRCHAALVAEQAQARGIEVRRAQLQQDVAACQNADERARHDLAAQDRVEQARWQRLNQRVAQRQAQTATQRQLLQDRVEGLRQILATAPAVLRAARRVALADHVCTRRDEGVIAARAAVQTLAERRHLVMGLEQRMAGLEREAGQAVLQAETLARRLGLSQQVPCAGTALQARCSLLSDAREAQTLLPSAQHQISKLAEERDTLAAELGQARAGVAEQSGAPMALLRAEQLSNRAVARHAQLAQWAARAGEMAQAQRSLVDTEAELAALANTQGPTPTPTPTSADTAEETEERELIQTNRRRIAEQITAQQVHAKAALQRLHDGLRTLPPQFDQARLDGAAEQVTQTETDLAVAERTHLDAIRAGEKFAAVQAQAADLGLRRAAAAQRTAGVEQELANWLLFARCMGNDGLIALAIDDAGPTLSGLVNDLLMACYGPRFAVGIETLQHTAKGELREGFDVCVYDAESGDRKSVGAMSGGERVWVNECLVRAVALYLAQNTGRRYDTLFSDEADGPLDPERKRMFMAMKRRVLDLGGYRREYFVSQTPELTAMADVVIDLDALATVSLGA